MLKRLTRVVPVFLIILIPWFFYWFLRDGKHTAKPIGYFGTKTPTTKIVDGKELTDTIYHAIKSFSLVDLNNQPYTDAELKKYFHVIGTFNTNNKNSIVLFEKLYFLQDEVSNKTDVRILAITNQPLSDSISVLKKFISGKRVDLTKWFLLTGDETEINSLLNQSFFIPIINNKATDSDQLFLVDKNKHIRGIYDGTDEVELKRLFDELKVLRLEFAEKKNTGK